jgi:hypothetical protein
MVSGFIMTRAIKDIDSELNAQICLYDMTPESIGIWTSGSKFIYEQHCFLVLSCIEEYDGLPDVAFSV